MVIGIFSYFYLVPPYYENKQDDETSDLTNQKKMVKLNVKSLFDIYAVEDDYEIKDGKKIWGAVTYALNPELTDLYDEMGILNDPQNVVVIYPLFTAAAYSEPGFYTFHRGECDSNCLTVKLKDKYPLTYHTNDAAIQSLSLLGYLIISDIDIDKDPSVLKKYDKVILLHNEYVTKKEFDAITNHPKVVYLYPNALYGEIAINYEKGTITLIRGHNYPTPQIRNGFDWGFDNSDLEYNTNCTNWKFYEIKNGTMLNCYPELIISQDKELLKAIKEY